MTLSESGWSVTVLCGGFGAARFLQHSTLAAPPEDWHVRMVVNTGDDFDYHRLHISPDLDSVLYALAGCFDEQRGWGLCPDTFHCSAALGRYTDPWFGIGDRDLAHHLQRSALLAEGMSLAEATRELAAAWQVACELLPMSNDPVRTVVATDEGELAFQDYVVRRRAEPRVHAVRYEGIDVARCGPGVTEAIADSDFVLLAPSNPVSSIGPILALPGLADALRSRAGPVVAVSPVVSSVAPRTPPERSRYAVREAFLAAAGIDHSPAGVAAHYGSLIDGFAFDERDVAWRTHIEEQGLSTLAIDTLAQPAARGATVLRLLEWASTLARSVR